VIEGKLEGRIEMTGKRGRRRKQLQNDLKEKKRYWKLKEEALDRTLWRTRFGRGYGSVVRQTTERMNELNKILAWGLEVSEATFSENTSRDCTYKAYEMKLAFIYGKNCLCVCVCVCVCASASLHLWITEYDFGFDVPVVMQY
jgi:hypothetical protein